jgi:hypothetical protein
MLNPFTKQLQEFEIPEPLTPAQWKSVVRVLKAPDEDFDTLNVEFPDGGQAQISKHSIGQIETLSVRIGSLTSDLTRFFIDLLKAADWEMVMDSTATSVVASEKLANGRPKDSPAVVCDSPEELGAMLSPGFSHWNMIRNQIANGTRALGNTPKTRRRKK